MKKLICLAVIAVLAAGILFSQGIQDERNQPNTAQRAERQRTPREQNAPGEQREQRAPQRTSREIETVTINGTLKLQNGFVAVETGEKTLLVPMLNRYIGFINGLQEGKTVSVEGIAARNYMYPRKLTIDGREYSFAAGMFAQAFAPRAQNTPQRFNAPHQVPNSRFPQYRFNAPRKNNDRNRSNSRNREDHNRRNVPQSSINSMEEQA